MPSVDLFGAYIRLFLPLNPFISFSVVKKHAYIAGCGGFDDSYNFLQFCFSRSSSLFLPQG